MGKWKMVRLGDVFNSIKNGASIKQGENKGAGIPITRIETISDGTINRGKMGYAGITDFTRYSDYILDSGDILMSHINSRKHLGKTALYRKQDGEVIIHGMNLLRLKVDKNRLNSVYANYYFKSYFFKQQLPRITKNSVNQSSFTVTALKELSIPAPPLDIQQKIADVLDKASALIELRKAQLDKLDLLIRSQFIEMFGLPGSNNGKWQLYRLGDCCELNPRKSSDSRLTSDLIVSFIPMSSISENGSIDTAIHKSYDEVKTGFTYFMDNDVLFAKITPCMENGKGAVAKELCNGVGFGSTEFHVLRPIKGESNAYWLYTLTALKHFRLDAATNMTGSAGQRRVPATYLENYKVSLPPISLQNEFAAFVEQVEAQKKLLQQSLEKMELNYKSLMQKCFRGEIF